MRAVYSRTPQHRGLPSFGLGGPGGRAPRDLVALLALLFVTFSLQFFAATAAIPALLRLTPAVWQRLWLWQLVSYPFVGTGAAGVWVLLELFFLYLFGRDVHRQLGVYGFWRLLLGASLVASVVAVATQLALASFGLGAPAPFVLMQGQHLLFAVLIAAFAALFRDATIYLFFVLPVQARWFVPIELLLAFVGFLSTHDFAGFVGLSSAVGASWFLLAGGRRGAGLRETRRRLERWWLSRRLERLKRRSGLRVVRDRGRDTGGGPGPWVH
jgi:hypothetical protein